MTPTPVGPAQLVLTASVARLYYVSGRSKTEIAEQFGLSRFKVARLLERARAAGLVHIEIRCQGVIDVERSGRLQDRFGLRHALVLDVPDDDAAALRSHLGRAAADLLSEIVTGEDVLGLCWARTVSSMAQALTRLPPVPVVQLTGALSRPEASDSSIEVVRQVAGVAGGRAYYFYAPLIVEDADTATVLRRQPEIVRAFERIPCVTKAVVGVGMCEPGLSVLYDALDRREQRRLRDLGVCADISGVLIDADGEAVDADLTRRMIGVSAQQLRAVPEVLAIAYGTSKVPAVRAALASGILDGLVTHSTVADRLLAAT